MTNTMTLADKIDLLGACYYQAGLVSDDAPEGWAEQVLAIVPDWDGSDSAPIVAALKDLGIYNG